MTYTDKLTKREQDIAKGSIKDVAESRGERPEDIMAEADVVVMLDESGSMNGGGPPSKHERAVDALRQIQATFPGRVILISFSDSAEINLNGLPKNPGGGTNMGMAMELGEQFTGLDMKYYMISDGQPTDGDTALRVAERMSEPINTIFIGDDFDTAGQAFLNRLAQINGGKSRDKVDPKELGETVVHLLTDGR